MKTPILQSTLGNRQLQLQLLDVTRLYGHGRKTCRTDYKEMVQSQFDAPIEFPPLMQSILADDKIAIALEDGVPDGLPISCEIIRYLLDRGIDFENITWVIASTHRPKIDLANAELQKFGLPPVKIVLHDPRNIESHAYVAASEAGDAIYVQRELIDADVLLPIYCARTNDCPHASDLFGISPDFTDAATQQRWNIAWLEDNISHLHEHDKLSQEVGWLAGIHFAIAVVPSINGCVAEILAGKPDVVFELATQALESPADESFDLVISTVDGDTQQQSWLSVARAASYAERLCNTNGRIVICCDVQHATKGIRDLRSDEPVEEANRRVIKSHAEDAFAAAVLRLITSERSLYLHSSLPANETESLGFAHIQSAEEIEHLIAQADSSCVIRGAQY